MADNIKLDAVKPEAKKLTSVQETALKSFLTGTGVASVDQDGAGALRAEVLETEVAMQTWGQDDLSFYNDLYKTPAGSTVVQYAVYLTRGRVGSQLFTNEVGVSDINDPGIQQRTVTMKFLSDTRELSIASMLVGNIQEPSEILLSDSIAVIAKTIEWASFYGDASLNAQGNESGLQFDGLAKLIDKDNVIDLKGKELTEAVLNQGALTVAKGFGVPTDAYMPIGVHTALVNKLLDRQVQLVNNNGNSITTGYNVQGFNSSRGFIRLHGSTIMEIDNILDEYAVPKADAPHAPKVKAEVVAEAKGKFREEELAKGAHKYRVIVNSEKGASAPSDEVEAVITKAKNGVKLTVEVISLFTHQPQYISIYREGLSTRQFYLIAQVPISKASDNKIEFIDVNDNIAETADVFMGEMSPQVVTLYELLPMVKIPLARTRASQVFTVLWYGGLALKAPKKWVRIKNVSYIATDNIRTDARPKA